MMGYLMIKRGTLFISQAYIQGQSVKKWTHEANWILVQCGITERVKIKQEKSSTLIKRQCWCFFQVFSPRQHLRATRGWSHIISALKTYNGDWPVSNELVLSRGENKKLQVCLCKSPLYSYDHYYGLFNTISEATFGPGFTVQSS